MENFCRLWKGRARGLPLSMHNLRVGPSWTSTIVLYSTAQVHDRFWELSIEMYEWNATSKVFSKRTFFAATASSSSFRIQLMVISTRRSSRQTNKVHSLHCLSNFHSRLQGERGERTREPWLGRMRIAVSVVNSWLRDEGSIPALYYVSHFTSLLKRTSQQG